MNVKPLPHEYMITGIIGFFVSVFMMTDKTWSFALGLFFLLLVIASMISISGDAYDEETLDLVAGAPYQRKKKKVLR